MAEMDDIDHLNIDDTGSHWRRQGEKATACFIGRGGHGEVWKISNLDTSLCFARKLIRTFPEARDEAINEIKAIEILCAASHSNIIQVFGHGRLNSAFTFIEMELCDIDLQQYIHGDKTVGGINGLLEWRTAEVRGQRLFLLVAILQQLLTGLSFIHGCGVVHRDLDPRNVLYSVKSGWWKIADFGLTSTANGSQLVTTSNARGKPGYRAPELLGVEPKYTKSSDIWALGCIVCELCHMAGQNAFADDFETRQFMFSKTKAPMIFPVSFDHASRETLQSWINEMLQSDPTRRPSAENLLLKFQQLVTLLSDETSGRKAGWDSDPTLFSQPKFLLGTDLPTVPRGRWEDILAEGNFSDHIQAHERRIAIASARERWLGANHRNTLSSKALLAWTYFHLGPSEVAIAIFTEILQVMPELEGDNDRERLQLLIGRAWATTNISTSWKQVGKASLLFGEVVQVLKQKLGPLDPLTLTGLMGLGRTLSYEWKLPEAVKLLQQVHKDQETILGLEDPETVESMTFLASAYYRQGRSRWEKAAQLYEKAFNIYSRTLLPKEHPDTLLCLADLAATRQKQGRLAEAVQLYQEVIPKQKAILGSDSTETKASVEGLAKASLKKASNSVAGQI